MSEGASRRATLVALLVALLLLGGGAAGVVWSAMSDSPPGEGQYLRADGLRVTVIGASRRADAMTGVNTARQATSGPNMAMPGMNSIEGSLEHGEERIDVSVQVVNDSGAPAALPVDDFSLWSRGRPVRLLQPTVSELSTAALDDGMRMTGTLTFVVAEGTSPLTLRYGDSAPGLRLRLEGGTSGGSGHGEGSHGPGHG